MIILFYILWSTCQLPPNELEQRFGPQYSIHQVFQYEDERERKSELPKGASSLHQKIREKGILGMGTIEKTPQHPDLFYCFDVTRCCTSVSNKQGVFTYEGFVLGLKYGKFILPFGSKVTTTPLVHNKTYTSHIGLFYHDCSTMKQFYRE